MKKYGLDSPVSQLSDDMWVCKENFPFLVKILFIYYQGVIGSVLLPTFRIYSTTHFNVQLCMSMAEFKSVVM